MNRFFYGFIAFLFLFLSIYPFSNVFADNDLVVTGTPIPVQGDITDDQLKDMIVAGITADLVSQGYSIDLSASDGDWDNFKNAILDYIFNQAQSGSGFIGEIYNSALQHNLIDEDFTLWYPDINSTYLPGISKRSIYRNLSDGLVNNILESRSNGGSTPTPTPDPDYLSLIETINGSGFYFKNWDNGYWSGQIYYPHYPLYEYSYRSINNGFGDGVSNYGTIAQLSGISDIYITSINDLYSFNVSYTMLGNNFVVTRTQRSLYGRIGPDLTWIAGLSTGANTGDTQGYYDYSGTLYQCLSVVASYFRNVNIYVDGVPWSIVGENQLPTIYINPGYILQGTNLPMVYNFPEPPYFDYNAMIDIIKHALLQYGVIQWEDIADVFVDVNGQTAVAILEMHRNDYDVLYDEQYPGVALPDRFNTHLLDSSHQYLSPVIQTVEETTGVLPGEIKGALAIGMMLTIFACLIHRLLE